MKNVHKAGVRAPCTTRNGMPNEHMYGNAVLFALLFFGVEKFIEFAALP